MYPQPSNNVTVFHHENNSKLTSYLRFFNTRILKFQSWCVIHIHSERCMMGISWGSVPVHLITCLSHMHFLIPKKWSANCWLNSLQGLKEENRKWREWRCTHTDTYSGPWPYPVNQRWTTRGSPPWLASIGGILWPSLSQHSRWGNCQWQEGTPGQSQMICSCTAVSTSLSSGWSAEMHEHEH